MLDVSTEASTMTVEQYLAQWLDHMKGRVRIRVHQGYACLVNLHAIPQLGELLLGQVRPLHLQSLYAQLMSDPEHPLSAGTVLNLHLVLTQAFGQAVRWELLGSNPSAGAQPPRPRRRELEVVDPVLAEQILEAVRGTPLEVPAAIALATGMRRGEILALRWADLDSELTTAHVGRTLQQTGTGLVFEQPKTRRSRRSVALPEFLRPYLLRQREAQYERRAKLGAWWHESGLVVDAGDGSPMNPGTLSSGWYRFLKRNSLPHIRFHDLRHGHATIMLLKGIHPKVVSERLGHASIGITLDTYSHVLPEMQPESPRVWCSL